MASIIIAGRPNSEDTSKCILLAENLQSIIPTAKYRKILKHPIDWDKYSETICNLFGFIKKSHPLIFYSNGNFVGGKEEYFKLVKNNFNVPSLFNKDGEFLTDDEIVKNLTLEHINQVNKEFLLRKQGLTIRDKIEEKLDKFSSQDFRSSSINDRYNTLDMIYSTEFLGDMKIFYKISSKFSPADGEYIKYEDQIEENKIYLETENEKSGISNMINNQIGNGKVEYKGTRNTMVQYSDEEEEEEENLPKKREIIYYTYKKFLIPEISFDQNEFYKYEIDSNFGLNFQLLLNPFLTFYGEALLSTHIADKKNSSNDIIILDIGRIPSLRPISYDEELLSHLKSQNINLTDPNTNNLVSNLDTNILNFSSNKSPLTEQDVHSMITAVKSINGIAMLRVLPNKHADYKHFGSSKIKILPLPLKDIDYQPIPLSLKINQAIKNLKRDKIKELVAESKISKNNLKLEYLIENEEFTHYFEIHECFKVECYSENGIRHLIKSYDDFNISSSIIMNDLKIMFRELKINNETGYGFNLILSNNYLFVAPLVNPYVYDKEIPIFAEPNFFAGIFTLPIIRAEWPETTKGEYLNFDFAEILQKSTN